LLSSLAEIGLLQWREGGRYRIGWRVLELAEVRHRTFDVRAAAEPVLARLVAKHGETSHLAIRERYSVLYVEKVLGTHNITVQGAKVGTRLEMHCTAVGKVLLATADPGFVDEFLATTPMPRHTASTITDPDKFQAELAEIRGRGGIGFDLGEAVEDVYCVAAPIRDELGAVVAALSMSSPIHRFTRNRSEYAVSVRAAAQEISRALVDSAPSREPDTRDYPTVVKLR